MQIAGSVLWLLAYGAYVMIGDPMCATRPACADVLSVYAVERTCSRFTNVQLNMFVVPTSPTVGAPALSGKGAEIRHLICVLQAVWRKYADAALPQYQHVDLLLTSLSDIYNISGWKRKRQRLHYS